MIRRMNTILYCERWEATVAFYRDLLALSVAHERDWFVEFKLGERAYLSIANAARATIASARGDGITLSWQVDDLAAARQMLQNSGIDCTPIRTKWGAQLCYFHDPEGHRLELWQPIPE